MPTLPVATIKHQIAGTNVLANCPIVLVDDTGYTVDDSRACIGSIVIRSALRSTSLRITKPRGK